MKNIIKIIGVALLMTAFTQSSKAQVKFNAGAELGFAMNSGMGLAYGLALGLENPMGDNLGITFQTGYDIISVDGPASAALIPFQAGLKYYLTDNTEGIYLHGQAGMSMFLVSFGGSSNSETKLSFAPGAGYILNENIDLGLRYQMVLSSGSSLKMIALRAAYSF
ncbi:MAG: outer membrane beta-barrel protein [Vicingaceae bacterium]|nr:outer membrane beta-barrel protein [Vicingaceae bacterium]